MGALHAPLPENWVKAQRSPLQPVSDLRSPARTGW